LGHTIPSFAGDFLPPGIPLLKVTFLQDPLRLPTFFRSSLSFSIGVPTSLLFAWLFFLYITPDITNLRVLRCGFSFILKLVLCFSPRILEMRSPPWENRILSPFFFPYWIFPIWIGSVLTDPLVGHRSSPSRTPIWNASSLFLLSSRSARFIFVAHPPTSPRE